jgi:hypothetical protein
LFHALRKAGIDDCYLQPNLDNLILQLLGLDDNQDKTFAVYNSIMDKRCRKMDANRNSIVKQAFKTYLELTGNPSLRGTALAE